MNDLHPRVAGWALTASEPLAWRSGESIRHEICPSAWRDGEPACVKLWFLRWNWRGSMLWAGDGLSERIARTKSGTGLQHWENTYGEQKSPAHGRQRRKMEDQHHCFPDHRITVLHYRTELRLTISTFSTRDSNFSRQFSAVAKTCIGPDPPMQVGGW